MCPTLSPTSRCALPQESCQPVTSDSRRRRRAQVRSLDCVRVPRMDLGSAVAILSTGALPLPTSLRASDRASADALTPTSDEDLDDLLRTRLSAPPDAAALQVVLQQAAAAGGRPGSLELRGGVALLTVPGQFSAGLTVRAKDGPWMLCWVKILVQKAETAAGAKLDESHARAWADSLRTQLQRGASLQDVLTTLQHDCLRLQLAMLRTQATQLQRGRFAIQTSDPGRGADSSELVVSYWAAPTPVHACQIAIRQQGGRLCVRHSPSLAQASAPTPRSELEHISSESVSFERLLVATMRARAADRVHRVQSALRTCAADSGAAILVAIPDRADAAGFSYVDVRLPSARLELHVRRENGLLQVQQPGGWRDAAVFSNLQTQLDDGCGILGADLGTHVLGAQRQLILESIASKAKSLGLRALDAPKFQTRETGTAAPSGAFSVPGEDRLFLRIAEAAALVCETGGDREQFVLSVSVADDNSLRPVLGAFFAPTSGSEELVLSAVLELGAHDGPPEPPGHVEVQRKRQAVGGLAHGRSMQGDGGDDSESSREVPRSANQTAFIGALCRQAHCAVMAHRLRRALLGAGLQHVWISHTQASVSLPGIDGLFDAGLVVLRVLPSMQWQCMLALQRHTAYLKTRPAGVGRNSGTCHCDGDKVYIRYGVACSIRQLCRDVCRVAHMVSIAESAQREDAASSPWLSVRAVGITQLAIECRDARKTMLRIDLTASGSALRVTLDPPPPPFDLHFVAKTFFPKSLYHVGGCAPATEPAADPTDAIEATDVADVVACARYLCEGRGGGQAA